KILGQWVKTVFYKRLEFALEKYEHSSCNDDLAQAKGSQLKHEDYAVVQYTVALMHAQYVLAYCCARANLGRYSRKVITQEKQSNRLVNVALRARLNQGCAADCRQYRRRAYLIVPVRCAVPWP